MLLKFNSDAVLNGKLLYREGDICEVPEENGFAMRWVRRGAEIVEIDPTQPIVDSVVVPEKPLKPKRNKGAKNVSMD